MPIAAMRMRNGLSTPPSDTDPFYANVSLLLHADGVTNTAVFTDNSPRVKVPAYVGTTLLSDQQKKYGPTSLRIFNGGDRLQYAEHEDFGTGDGAFTVEAWVRLNEVTNYINNVFDTRSPSRTGVGLWVGGGRFGLPPNLIGFSSNSAVLAYGGTIPTDGSFVHVRWTRDTDRWTRGYINGVLAFEHLDNRVLASLASLVIGADAFGTADQVAFGYIDEVRFTKGVDRGGGLPSSPFPNS